MKTRSTDFTCLHTRMLPMLFPCSPDCKKKEPLPLSPVGSETASSRTETFTYDALGNRVDHTDTATSLTEHYETNNLNQYTQITSIGVRDFSPAIDSGINPAAPLEEGDSTNSPDESGTEVPHSQNDTPDNTTLDATSPATQDETDNDSQNSQATSTVNSNLKTVNLTYDAKGNLLSDGKRWYAYDAQNRLTEVRTLTDSAQFYYDASNRCILRVYAKFESGAWVTDEENSVAMVYDRSWNLLTDYDMNGKVKRDYVHGTKTDEVICAGGLYPLTDAQGSVLGAANETGGLESSYTYEAFGRLSSSRTVSSDYRFLFAGRERLARFGLTEMRNRYYSASLGRFINADPSGFNGGINLYAYCYNDPSNNIDPFGLNCPPNAITNPEQALQQFQQQLDSLQFPALPPATSATTQQATDILGLAVAISDTMSGQVAATGTFNLAPNTFTYTLNTGGVGVAANLYSVLTSTDASGVIYQPLITSYFSLSTGSLILRDVRTEAWVVTNGTIFDDTTGTNPSPGIDYNGVGAYPSNVNPDIAISILSNLLFVSGATTGTEYINNNTANGIASPMLSISNTLVYSETAPGTQRTTVIVSNSTNTAYTLDPATTSTNTATTTNTETAGGSSSGTTTDSSDDKKDDSSGK